MVVQVGIDATIRGRPEARRPAARSAESEVTVAAMHSVVDTHQPGCMAALFFCCNGKGAAAAGSVAGPVAR